MEIGFPPTQIDDSRCPKEREGGSRSKRTHRSGLESNLESNSSYETIPFNNGAFPT